MTDSLTSNFRVFSGNEDIHFSGLDSMAVDQTINHAMAHFLLQDRVNAVVSAHFGLIPGENARLQVRFSDLGIEVEKVGDPRKLTFRNESAQFLAETTLRQIRLIAENRDLRENGVDLGRELEKFEVCLRVSELGYDHQNSEIEILKSQKKRLEDQIAELGQKVSYWKGKTGELLSSGIKKADQITSFIGTLEARRKMHKLRKNGGKSAVRHHRGPPLSPHNPQATHN